MSFEMIYEDIKKLGNPQAGDLILFQIEDGQWTAATHPILAQMLYADDYDAIEQKALEWAADWAEKGRIISIWKEGDANKGEYFKIL